MMANNPHGPSSESEFPALLSAGFHAMTLDDIRRTCVDDFPLSTTRIPIMDGIASVCQRLENERIGCDAWLDGSFLTKKIDPNDIDVVFRIPFEVINHASPRQLAAIKWASDIDRVDSHRCDSYAWHDYPASHENAYLSVDERKYWTRWYGHDRGGEQKGIAVVKISGGAA